VIGYSANGNGIQPTAAEEEEEAEVATEAQRSIQLPALAVVAVANRALLVHLVHLVAMETTEPMVAQAPTETAAEMETSCQPRQHRKCACDAQPDHLDHLVRQDLKGQMDRLVIADLRACPVDKALKDLPVDPVA